MDHSIAQLINTEKCLPHQMVVLLLNFPEELQANHDPQRVDAQSDQI
jgi:hypothetical protein